MFNQKLNNLGREQRKMPAKRLLKNGQNGWPSASHLKAWERQWLNTNNRNEQQQEMDEPTTLSAAMMEKAEENLSIDGENENEPVKMEEEDEDDVQELEMLPKANVGGRAQKKSQKLETLIHTRQLLEEVLCPWEKIQQFIKLCQNDYWKKLTPRCSIDKCLVAFHVNVKGRGDEELVYIDQIKGMWQGTIQFEHYGAFGIDTIQPHNEPISDEDFERWLDKLISSGEELPTTGAKLQAKKHFFNFVNDLISTSICEELQQNPKMHFDGMEQIGKQMVEQLGIDISRIILHPKYFLLLLKLTQPEFAELMTGLYVQVKISEITHSMKLPPKMTLLDHLLIPISMVTFNSPKRYKVPYMTNQMSCKVMVHVKNAKGDVICSAQLPQEMELPSEQQLVQKSLTIWRMNYIPLPIFDNVHQKSRQLENAFVSTGNIKFDRVKGTLPMRGQFRENKQINRQEKVVKIQVKMLRKLNGSGNDGPKQKIGQQIVRPLNCQMPANFENIILNAEQFQNLYYKLPSKQFEELVVGIFVHAIIPKNFTLQKALTKSVFLSIGHLIVPIAGISYKSKKGRRRVHIHLPKRIKLVCDKTGRLLQRITNNQLGGVCANRLIEECAMILNACKIALPTEEFITQKERKLRRWL